MKKKERKKKKKKEKKEKKRKKKKKKEKKEKKEKKGKEKRSDAQNPLSVVLTGDNNHHSVICTISWSDWALGMWGKHNQSAFTISVDLTWGKTYNLVSFNNYCFSWGKYYQ